MLTRTVYDFFSVVFPFVINKLFSTLLYSRPAHPDGYRTLDPSYRAPSRNQLDPYAAQPQVCV